jgi:hypothetical protein
VRHVDRKVVYYLKHRAMSSQDKQGAWSGRMKDIFGTKRVSRGTANFRDKKLSPVSQATPTTHGFYMVCILARSSITGTGATVAFCSTLLDYSVALQGVESLVRQ